MKKPSTAYDGGFDEIQRRFAQMLEDGRHIFDAAANALVGGTDPEVIRKDLFATDRRINSTEQEIRRMIVINGTVHGAQNFPSLLVTMSVAKDAERIGDYAKNIFDLAADRARLGKDEHPRLVSLKDRISKLLVRARYLYEQEDEQAARELLGECDKLEDECDEGMRRALAADHNASADALAYRYFKRVVSHTANVATALVMPLDMLDFFDEDDD